MKRIAVLIPVFNKLEYTKSCLESLHLLVSSTILTKISVQIIVIDDGSTDGTKEWITNNYSDITVLEGDGNLWWSGGINMGARWVIEEDSADYILLWNNDIEAGTDYFEQLDNLIPHLENNIIAGSKIYCKHPSDQIWSFGGVFNPRSGKIYMIGFEQPENGNYNSPAEVDWLPGMGTLVHKSVIENIGFWDEQDFPQYHGDSDFTFRAKTAGYIIKVYPQLKLWNDNKNTGLSHNDKFKFLLRMLSDTRSNLNLKKNILFYRRHSTSIVAFWPLFTTYFRLFGGFIKWKILNLFGVTRDRP